MPLAPGARLGPFEILNPIGAGGMGEVYKVRDTRLDRIVAVKVSKEAFSERFEREARAVARLNHPNICQLYDVGSNYLVMEFIEGTPIAPVDSTRKLLDIAVQIAEGLAAAHAAGIVHRDLKPDNILITREGRIKVLDFGLAKAVAHNSKSDDVTRMGDITDVGTAIGTIAYMSPEQARGTADLTPQSDQFSLGLILYELASGNRPFPRPSAAEIMTAIIREDAAPLPATVPAPLRWIVERLLAKDPADRYDSTRDLYRELRQVRDRLAESTTASGIQPAVTGPAPKRTQRWPIAWVFAAGLALAILAGAAGWILKPAAGVAQYRFTPMEVSWENPTAPVWSPDGQAFAYDAGAPGNRRVFLRYLNSPTAKPVTPGADSWSTAGWSPDSKRVIVRGKNPQGDTPRFALFSVPVVGGDPEMIMPMDTAFPSISADGKAIAGIRFERGKLTVVTASPVGSALQPYTPAPFESTNSFNVPYVEFSADGRSIILVEDVLGGRQVWLLPYPPGRAAPQRVMKNLPSRGFTPRWSWFPDGRNGVLSLANGSGTHLWLAGMRSGLGNPLTTGPSDKSESQPALSPDGKRLLFIQTGSDYIIASASLSNAAVERVISSGMEAGMPAWARHQDSFVYASARTGSPAIWMRSGGWDRPIVTAEAFPPGTTNTFMTPTPSPGADRVVYTRSDNRQSFENWISSVSGGPPVRLTNVKDVYERGGSWSPDGGRLAYWQARDNRISLMVVKTGGEATPVLLRDDVGNILPEWSPDGQWITFLDDTGWNLISPDGKTVRNVGEPKAIQLTFSADSKRLYGIRAEEDRRILFSLDIATKETRRIGQIGNDFMPASYSNPGIRLSLSPDGKSILFPALRRNYSLWMLEGFEQPGWLDQLREMLPW